MPFRVSPHRAPTTPQRTATPPPRAVGFKVERGDPGPSESSGRPHTGTGRPGLGGLPDAHPSGPRESRPVAPPSQENVPGRGGGTLSPTGPTGDPLRSALVHRVAHRHCLPPVSAPTPRTRLREDGPRTPRRRGGPLGRAPTPPTHPASRRPPFCRRLRVARARDRARRRGGGSGGGGGRVELPREAHLCLLLRTLSPRTPPGPWMDPPTVRSYEFYNFLFQRRERRLR